MATYKKPLKYMIGETLATYTFTAEDTADGNRIGSYAVEAFKAKKTIKAENGGKETLIPFHAIKSAHYGAMTADAEKADAYCGGGTEPIGEVWYTVTVPSGECNESGYAMSMTPTPNARTSELVGNPNAYDVSVNGVVMSVAMAGGGAVAFSDAGLDDFTVMLEIDESTQALDLKCPPRFDAGTNVEVTVTKK